MIPHKPKKEPVPESNGVEQTNGKHALDEDVTTKDLKRARPDETDDQPSSAKKAKTATKPEEDDIVVVDDGGAILIDD